MDGDGLAREIWKPSRDCVTRDDLAGNTPVMRVAEHQDRPRPLIRDFESRGFDGGIYDRPEPQIRKMLARKAREIDWRNIDAAYPALGDLRGGERQSDRGRPHAAAEFEHGSRPDRHD